MIKSTTDYDMFIFRKDNREKIDQSHLRKIKSSIESRNLLHMRPIAVNARMEIIDGQHRCMAAQQLGIPIYYEVQEDLQASDIIAMNISKAWGMTDYFNFYVKNNYPEYIKLKDFILKNNISLRIGMALAIGESHKVTDQFKKGNFKFEMDAAASDLWICSETVRYIKKIKGYAPWTNSSKFWRAMVRLFSHPDFKKDQWYKNSRLLIDNFEVKPNSKSYLDMVQYIYNYKSRDKLDIKDRENETDK